MSKHSTIFCLLVTLFIAFAAGLSLARETVTVAHVIDGDTFITTNGDHVRLIGVNTPEQARQNHPAEPYAEEAKQFTKNLIENKQVELEFEELQRDRYKRLLAHAYLPDGTWVNAQILKTGHGHLYSFPDNRGKIRQLEGFANTARSQKIGLWQLPRWQVLNAENPLPASTIGQFHLVQGRVLHTAKARGTVYLNFGPDWRTDFSVEIRPQDLEIFKQEGIPKPQEYYKGKTLLIRGVIKPVNGWLITVTHPEQLSVLSDN